MTDQPVLHVVLHQPEIPQNAGNVGRTCVAVGAKLWLVRPLGFRLEDRHLRRAGLDYWDQLEWEAVDDWNVLSARLSGGRTWFFSKSAARAFSNVEYRLGDVLVFGSETQGLPDALRVAHLDCFVRIPTRDAVRSLNLASAAAVGIYEAVRQLTVRGVLELPA